ncbi:fatty acid desaturase [Lichenihabitans sp. Uapishka_5]|uniref:fatty acid desaturase n=1 Tax=Lichenihabitans sp. Uapishka_5 TaxID=3037302 RepID=UPI0029E7E982|nr:fatty acid desaturase [Lichenihabitans sp. Uapishka_5]MDX7950454.1 fatty acid desaturase [Lichenihabitans sp. Uapishka_5]
MSATLAQKRSGTAAQSLTGLGLAALIIAAWLVGHIYGVFLHRWDTVGSVATPFLMLLQCWLSVGLFIVAHDGMHGSLAPYHPRLNRAVGRLCLVLYAGFSYDRLVGAHFDHHRHPGTALDPDFYADDPEHLWSWYTVFFRRYFGWRPFLTIAVVVAVYKGVFGAGMANILLLWAVPAVISSLQLFYFGTFLPHRHEDDDFADQHNARSNNYPWLVSLLTCFHFGYHHEHHLAPQLPWWRLPSARQP